MTKTYVAIAAAVLLLSSFGCYLLWERAPHIAHENGLLESGQALFFGLATVFSLALIKGNRPNALPWSFLALLFLSALLREMDIEDFGWPALLIFLGSGIGRNVLIGAGWLLFLYFFLRRFSENRERFLRFFHGCNGSFFLAGCLLLLAGYPFDKNRFGLAKPVNLFSEEILEWGGAFLLLQIPSAGLLLLLRPVSALARDSDLEVMLPGEASEKCASLPLKIGRTVDQDPAFLRLE